MNQTDLKTRFDDQGFLHIPALFNAREADELEAAVVRYLAEVAPGLPPGFAMYETEDDPSSVKQLQYMERFDTSFRDLLHCSRLTALARALLGDEVVPQNVEAFIKPPYGGSATPPHQDGYYFCLEPNEAVTFWLPVGEIDAENGALCYLAGSHRVDIQPHEASAVLGFSQGLDASRWTDRYPEVVCAVRKGDALVHHSRTIHYAAGNRSSRMRRAIGVIYFAERAQVNDRQRNQYTTALRVQHEALGAVI